MHRRACCAMFLVTLLVSGCAKTPPGAAALKPPEVLVGLPLVREVTDFEIFTGRTESSRRVDIRARATGYLEQAPFSEGARVKEGDLLFAIDPRPYRAELTRAEATLNQARAAQNRSERDYDRAQTLFARQALSREEYDRLISGRDEAKAAVGVAEANVELAKLSLQYTEVRAPFAGLISRRLVDPGNLVRADETILTTLVAVEPMYAYFDVDERTLLRQLLREGRLESASQDRVAVQIGLSDEDGFPHAGVVNFVDNRVDPNTGTMWMRAEFTHTKRPIKPGIFIRARFPLGQPYQAVLVAEQALGSDQGQRFLYVIGGDNKASYRQVKIGRLHDGLRVIQDGLKPGERVVVTGLQRVRAGTEITPKEVDMMTRVAKTRAEDDGTPPTVRSPLPEGKHGAAAGGAQ